MASFRKMLLYEQNRMEKILQKTLEQLENAPKGSLRITKTRKWIQYYHYLPEEKKNGKYISKTNERLIRKLAQKSFIFNILPFNHKKYLYVYQLL